MEPPDGQAWLAQVLEEHRQQILAEIQALASKLTLQVPLVPVFQEDGGAFASRRSVRRSESGPVRSSSQDSMLDPDDDPQLLVGNSVLESPSDGAGVLNTESLQAENGSSNRLGATADPTSPRTGMHKVVHHDSTGMGILAKEDTQVNLSSGFAHELVVRSEMQALGAPSARGYQRKFYNAIVGVSLFLNSMQEPPRRGWLSRLVGSSEFETFCGTVIVFNSGIAAYIADLQVRDYKAEVPNSFQTVEFIFVCWYVVELSLRLALHRGYFFVNYDWKYNILDVVLVTVTVADFVLNTAVSEDEQQQTNVTFMRVLRVLRIARALRALRALKLLRDLAVIVDCFRMSAAALFWAVVCILFMLYTFAIMFTQGVHGYLQEEGDKLSAEAVDNIMQDFGTLGRAMRSLYQACTGGRDWHEFYLLISEAGDFYAAAFVGFTFIMQFWCFSILTGIFVEKAMVASVQDRDDMVLARRREVREQVRHFKTVVGMIDVHGTGAISWHDFEQAMHNEVMVAYMASIGLEIHEIRHFFQILTGSHGDSAHKERVDIAKFVEGCMHMKGTATAIDMQLMLYEAHRLRHEMKKQSEDVQTILQRELLMISRIAEEMQTLLKQNADFAMSERWVPGDPDSMKRSQVASIPASKPPEITSSYLTPRDYSETLRPGGSSSI